MREVTTASSELAVADVVRGVSMLRKFNLPILGVVENMATFASDCGKIYRPFGDGSVNEVLAVVDDANVRAVALPISKADKAALGPVARSVTRSAAGGCDGRAAPAKLAREAPLARQVVFCRPRT